MRWWDIEELLPVEQALFPSDPWSAELFWSELAGVPGSRHYRVLESDDGVVLGYAGLAAAGREAEVHTLAVHPDAQGRGLGSLLLEDLLAEAERRRCTVVLLEVRADNIAAQRVYQRHGFERVGVRHGYYPAGGGGRTDALVLRRRLRPEPAGPHPLTPDDHPGGAG